MGELLFAVVAAFLIFMVLLPAVGILAGIFLRVALPYAAGFWVCFVIVWLCSGRTIPWSVVLAFSAVWVAAVWLARRKYQEQKGARFSWHEGHYTGAWVCLAFFAPLRKGAQVEVAPDLEECQAEA